MKNNLFNHFIFYLYISGIEIIYQAALQTVLLLFSQTNTPTTGGFDTFFQKSSLFGLPINPSQFLVISLVLSLLSNSLRHVKMIRMEKGFLRFKPQLTIALWVAFGSIRKVASIVAFFTPSLGLFSLLHHWQAECIPFKARLDMAKHFANKSGEYFQNAQIKLYNMSTEVTWSSLDRWNYEDPKHPKPPPYSVYTGLSLQETFMAFIVLLMVQILSLMVGKMCTSDAFVDTKTNHFSKITHLLQISNIPIPFEDWDAEKFDTIKPFKNTYKKIEREMCLSFVLTFIFTTTMMIPLAITGFFIPCSLS